MTRRILLFSLVWVGLSVLAEGVHAKVLRVPEDFKLITDAMREARYGDTVLVGPGKYDTPVDVKNGVVLKSEEGPEVTSIVSHRWWVVRLADADTLTAVVGFRISGGRAADRVVYCSGGGSPRILNNIVEKGWYGLSCEGSSPIVRDNVVRFNKQGIQCKRSSPLLLRNHVTRNYTGVVITDSSPRVVNNVIDLNETGILVEGYSLPVIGGSLEDANDIFENVLRNLVNNAMVKEDGIRTLERALLQAECNFWGSDCPDVTKFHGGIDYQPWVDKDHTRKMTSCPEG